MEVLPKFSGGSAPVQPIFVTRPLLEGFDGYLKTMAEVWHSEQLTNGGVQHRELERELGNRLGTQHLSLYNNGTTALLAALRVLGVRGSVVTTPFTFPATVHAIQLSGLTPLFSDVEETTLNLDPDLVESAVEADTGAVMPVHVFGRPCAVQSFEALCERRGLKLIYDAAHAFGVEIGGRGIATYGDASVFSFHATKLFHTVEGGAVAFREGALKENGDCYRNFGLSGPDGDCSVGLNGKMSELHAGVGRHVLKYVDEEIEKRKTLAAVYDHLLKGEEGIRMLADPVGAKWNYHYLAVRIDAERFGVSRDVVHDRLAAQGIFSRKYFFPLCSNLTPYRSLPSAAPDRLPIANRIASEVLCLPLFGALEPGQVERITETLIRCRS